MKKVPLEEIHIALGAKMVDYAGFNMPVEYSGVIKEHLNVRENAGLFDVSHMGEFIIEGPQSLTLLQYLTSNDISKITVGKAQYNCLLNDNGGIIDDLIIYRLADAQYMAIVNAANIEKDWGWINKNNSFKEVVLKNISEEKSLFALQGPKAIAILKKLVDEDVEQLKSFQFINTTCAGKSNVLIAATGYTGSGGVEICCSKDDAKDIWEAIMTHGEAFQLLPIGLAARDTLRLEKGYCLYGNDIDDTTTPLMAGLGWVTKLKKEAEFISKDILIKQKENGLEKKLVGISMLERGIPRKGYVIENSKEEKIGVVTSGTQSPLLKKGIGMAYVSSTETAEGNEVFVVVRNRKLKAQIVSLPFIK